VATRNKHLQSLYLEPEKAKLLDELAAETRIAKAILLREAVDDLLAGLAPGGTAVIATHGVAGRTVVAGLVGLDQHTAWQCLAGLHNCHWAEVHEYARAWRIVTWNVGANPL